MSLHFDPKTVLGQLTLAEKVTLLCGEDMWHTAPIVRLDVPRIRMSDGAHAIRGTKMLDPVMTNVFPTPSALAGTFNPQLLEEIGAMLGREAKAKGASCVLGPMANLTRSPLAGRGYDNLGEDPLLAGKLAGAMIRGIQSGKVVATLKHFVCNDVEADRKNADSVVSERALREIYLKPFEIATVEGKPRAYMAAYNRLNGLHASEHKQLLDIPRKEWGFDGLIMSDWYGTYSTAEALEAGLDLEMPGPSKLRGPLIEVMMTSGKLSQEVVDARVLQILRFVRDCVEAGVTSEDEGTIDTTETRELLRRAARESIVLLKNEQQVLPLRTDQKVAVIGHHAILPYYAGGEPALPKPVRYITPLQGIEARIRQSRAEAPTFNFGAYSHKLSPFLGLMHGGEPGYKLSLFNDDAYAEPALTMRLTDTIAFLSWTALEGVIPKPWLLLEGDFTPREGVLWDFGLVMIGRGRLYLDDELVVDNWTTQTRGEEFFGYGTIEQFGAIELDATRTYKLKLVMDSQSAFQVPGSGFRLGGARRIDVEAEREAACVAAEAADVAVVVVGLSHEWESEGFDRKDMKLPKDLNDLVSAVIARQPNTVVVVQCGTPVEMPWADDARAILMLSYPGNEGGHALADILYGASPSGKMSVTLPKRLEDTPSFLNFPGEGGRVAYGEGVFMGYRYYETTGVKPLFAFGHGLTYTSFDMTNLEVVVNDVSGARGPSARLTLTVRNTGSVPGAEVVQVYLREEAPSVRRPTKELAAFQRVELAPGQSNQVEIRLDRSAFAFWAPARPALGAPGVASGGWRVNKGWYEIMVGSSVEAIHLRTRVQVDAAAW